ncbi:MAG: hypothetical protein IPN17_11995 [Deltaproteobacteria bacterium]|nr:hypothetical protein [Deltaproteobacteria bacterium]
MIPSDRPAVAALAPLPPHSAASQGRFMTHEQCESCHAQATGVLTDSAGRDVSPPRLWRTSMMSMSARDPYWLAALEHEIAAQPVGRAYIERTCTRCHAPQGAIAIEDTGGRLRLDDVTRGTTAAAHLAREGVGCTGCHQITAEGLGTAGSFTGGFVVDTGRRIFGPHAAPFAMPMQNAVNYTPTQATHMTSSALCGSCHTVITRSLDALGNPTGPEFAEQAPYLEWRNSAFRAEGTPGATPMTCQGCHMPTRDAAGVEIRTLLSNRPRMLSARSPIGRHIFVGANAYMLSLLADESAWTGAVSSPAELREGAALAEAMLRGAATVQVNAPTAEGGAWAFTVRVANMAGHRFPTGYPSRRAWLHVRVLDAAGAVRWESGRADARGRLVARDGRSLEVSEDVVRPHYREVAREEDTQVYETVMADGAGRPTHVLLRAERYLKDNRILPLGWRSDHPDARLTSAAGVAGDADFVPGADAVRYRITASGWTPSRVEVELLFQSVPPGAVEAVRDGTTAAGERFGIMAEAHAPVPRVVAAASATVP